MLTPLALAIIAATILLTSFISGIFGMAGGMILLGVLLIWLDVPAAMVVFGLIQLVANGWRAFLWRAHIDWPIIGRYAIGAFIAATLFRLVAFVPPKPLIYVMLGVLPLVIDRLPDRFSVDITRRHMPLLCGMVTVSVQFIAGAAGHVLDQFFQKSPLDRKVTVATKATSQVIAHILRVLYFGSFVGSIDKELSAAWLIVAISLSMAGTTLAAQVLERMSDFGFKLWSRRIVLAIAFFYILRGLTLIIDAASIVIS